VRARNLNLYSNFPLKVLIGYKVDQSTTSFSTFKIWIVSMNFATDYRDRIAKSEVRLLLVVVSMVIQCDYGNYGRCN
jgi:hypothetical protein